MCGLKVIARYAKDCIWILILIDFPIGFRPIHIFYNIYLNEKYKKKKKKWNQHIFNIIRVTYINFQPGKKRNKKTKKWPSAGLEPLILGLQVKRLTNRGLS